MDTAPSVRDLSHSKIPRDGLLPGAVAPRFTLPSVDGRHLSLDDFRGHRLLLVFSDPACGPCQDLVEKLREVKVNASGPRILMVSRGDFETNRTKARQNQLRFPIVLQKQWEISRLYAMFATPAAYLIDGNGMIASPVAMGAGPILSLLAS